MGLNNFNKLIDLELFSDSESIKIKCPTFGRKPNISIKGTILPASEVNSFEVRVANLYLSDFQKYRKIRVSAGYENEKSTTIIGSINNSYIEKPAPDQITVFTCTMANFESLISKAVDLHFEAGESLTNIIKSISKKLNFYEPFFASDVSTVTIKAPLNETGLAKDVIEKLKDYFPDLFITVDSNRITVAGEEGTGKIYKIKNLKSPVQFGGGTVSISALWEPQLRANDIIEIETKYYTKDMSVNAANLRSKYRITTIQFDFSTVGGENSMTIQGVN